MKNYIFFSLFFLLVLNISAQKWDHTYGNPSTTESFFDLTEAYDKGYLLSSTYEMTNWANWLVKTDINGNVLWDKVISHANFDIIEGTVDQSSSGEIVLARAIYVNSSQSWPLVIKLDSCGNKLWCRVFIDNDYLYGGLTDVMFLDNGDILAVGYLESIDEIDYIFLYYINSDGDLLWRESYASLDDHPLLLGSRPPNGIYKSGNEYIIYGRCYYAYPENPDYGILRPFFIRIDSLFNEQWILPFGVNDNLIGMAYGLTSMNDSVYIGTGVEYSDENNSLFMYFNQEGEELGYIQLENAAIGDDINSNITEEIVRFNDSLFITSSIFGPAEMGNSFGELIIDTAGNVFKAISRPNTEGTSTLVKTFDDKFVIGTSFKHSSNDKDIYLYKINDSLEFDTVYTGNYTYDSLCPYQIESGTIDITDCMLVTDVGEAPTPKEYFASLNTIKLKAYPNPSSEGQITIAFSNTEQHQDMELRCFNVYGELVHEERVYPHQGESKVNTQYWKPGLYIATLLINGNSVESFKFTLVK